MSGDDMQVETEAGNSEVPNIDNLEPWLTRFVTEPDISYTGDPTHPMSSEEALKQTRNQYREKVSNREQRRNSLNQERLARGLPFLTKPAYEKSLVEELMDMAGIPIPATLKGK